MMIRKLKEQLRQRDAQIKEQAVRIKELEKQIEELKKLLVEKAKSKESKPPKEATNYSVARHERKHRKKHGHKNSTGRKPKDGKWDRATETVDLYWYGVNRRKCVLRREQFVWRLIDGNAKYVHYRIFDKPDSTELPPVDGVRNGKCEYGLEILITWLIWSTGQARRSIRRVGFSPSSQGLNCPSRRPTRCFRNWPRTGRSNTTRLPNW